MSATSTQHANFASSLIDETSITTDGTTTYLETEGYACLSFTASVTAISGSGSSIAFSLEASDNSTDWTHVHSTRRIDAIGVQRLSGIRLTARYYRYTWVVNGSTPSVDFNISSTLKNYLPTRTGSLFEYDDLDLKNASDVSTAYNAFSNTSVGCMIVRDTDGSTPAIIKLQGSNDSLHWVDQTGQITIASNQTIDQNFNGEAHRFYRAIVVSAATGGSASTCHIFWTSTGGA